MKYTMNRQQRGMTLIGWIIVLGLIAFFSLLALRLVPIYLDIYRIKETLHSLPQEPYIAQKTSYEIKQMLERKLYINYVESVQAKDFTVTTKGKKTTVGIEHEFTTPFIGNVSLLVDYQDNVEMVGGVGQEAESSQ
jgi:hypothetical protein